MKRVNDSAADWSPYYGLRFEVRLDQSASLETTAIPFGAAPDSGVHASVFLSGGTWRTITLPFSAFGNEQARTKSSSP